MFTVRLSRVPRGARVVCASVAACSVLALSACSSHAAHEGENVVPNCGHDVVFEREPQRVLTMGAESITTLSHLGVLDRVAARAGSYPEEYFDESIRSALTEVPSLTDRVDATGHIQISTEQVAAVDPDVVLGASDTVTFESMQAQGIPLINEPAFCGALEGPASFEDVWDQVATYGKVFHREERAAEYVAELKERLAELAIPGATDAGQSRADASPGRAGDEGSAHPLTVAVLYPTIGGGVTYAYGTRSMSHPVVEAAGLTNVYSDVNKRVFEVSAEDIAARQPDLIISLYTAGDPAAVVQATKDLPGAKTLPAIQKGRILPLLLNYAEPSTPLAVDGVEKIHEFADKAAAEWHKAAE
ncbi:ABC transporter substrate-binding protein [Corynebacterium sp. 320]|uniref:ABC transporter substrate-binding protein n=1 Tax=Corynebacterium TaxID=1716 RepID=UPI00125CBF8A|nr:MULTISPECIES: ABC transporter substrate-binding protein [Corynebacterium]KAB1504448.1 ABC transporter substrate-binding protein [Corynebacterium sp. 320]KAB1552453.1 ABC transporter substrate-binding protein [Corynebacterium sp. 321]KAB1554332.1 ABC transporter substrate-binding protein [Corynebacterium sp. 319]KAB3528584.1 ABC transporter substrate-binding protein [Corynebacterium sp. 250]KAB3539924.1 ABC transporter substrate-binding protein [Corynebacterium sp. 366]